jgi:heptosyltransferase-2
LRRALVVMPSWIGDTLLAQPLLARIHARHPGIVLDALAPDWTAPLVERMPEIASVIPSGLGHGDLHLGHRYRLARSIARTGHDAAWVLPNSLKSALVPWLAGIPLRIGFTGEARVGLLNRRHRLDKDAVPLMSERYAQLAEMPGSPIERPLPETRLRVDTQACDAIRARLGLTDQRPIVALCPGAEYGPAKRWPAERFGALATQLQRQGAQIWIFGSARDQPIAQSVIAAAAPVARASITDLCGRTRLGEAIDLLSLASAVVANDSGLMHVAAALHRPLVALYGSSSPKHTPPLDAGARLIWHAIECSPCYARECALGHFRCMKDITVGEVEQVLGARHTVTGPSRQS